MNYVEDSKVSVELQTKWSYVDLNQITQLPTMALATDPETNQSPCGLRYEPV